MTSPFPQSPLSWYKPASKRDIKAISEGKKYLPWGPDTPEHDPKAEAVMFKRLMQKNIAQIAAGINSWREKDLASDLLLSHMAKAAWTILFNENMPPRAETTTKPR